MARVLQLDNAYNTVGTNEKGPKKSYLFLTYYDVNIYRECQKNF